MGEILRAQQQRPDHSQWQPVWFRPQQRQTEDCLVVEQHDDREPMTRTGQQHGVKNAENALSGSRAIRANEITMRPISVHYSHYKGSKLLASGLTQQETLRATSQLFIES